MRGEATIEFGLLGIVELDMALKSAIPEILRELNSTFGRAVTQVKHARGHGRKLSDPIAEGNRDIPRRPADAAD